MSSDPTPSQLLSLCDKYPFVHLLLPHANLQKSFFENLFSLFLTDWWEDDRPTQGTSVEAIRTSIIELQTQKLSVEAALIAKKTNSGFSAEQYSEQELLDLIGGMRRQEVKLELLLVAWGGEEGVIGRVEGGGRRGGIGEGGTKWGTWALVAGGMAVAALGYLWYTKK
jgi:hypothetical protein